MGSPLSPILADIVMQDLEERAISILDLYFYVRYVDDIGSPFRFLPTNSPGI